MRFNCLLQLAARITVEKLECRKLFAGMDFGDAPETAAGPFYPTSFAGPSGNPARHIISASGPKMGAGPVDDEPDGLPDFPANRDDLTGFTPDDENGVSIAGVPLDTALLTPGDFVLVDIANTGTAGLVNAWFDWNNDGDWNDAGEQVAGDVAAPGGAVTTIGVMIPATVATSSAVYSRFRISTNSGLEPGGLSTNGEVEDYRTATAGVTATAFDFGDAPEPAYQTVLGGVGGPPARHRITPGPLLGKTIDDEPDGQPSADAMGDDDNIVFPGVVDDETGVTVGGTSLDAIALTPGSVLAVDVENGGTKDGFLNVWFDFGQDGSWAGDLVAGGIVVPAGGSVTVPVPLPAAFPMGPGSPVYSRFRISTVAALGSGGAAPDGEVEDYVSPVLAAPAIPTDFGDAPPVYPVGSHAVVAGAPKLGATEDIEPGPQPSIDALGDDDNILFAGSPDDEDGVTTGSGIPFEIVPLTIGDVATFVVTNTGGPGFMNAWFDWSQDGVWAAAPEHALIDIPMPAGAVMSFTIPVPAAIPGGSGSTVYSRFRISPFAGVGPAGFVGAGGEVEDYANVVESRRDFGDAPEAGPFAYPTSFAGPTSDPARHILAAASPKLGGLSDAEPDGQPLPSALGNDVNILFPGVDDEDGVTVGGLGLETFATMHGTVIPVEVTNPGIGGFLNAWVDFDRDGTWAHPAESVALDMPVPGGATIIVPVSIPFGFEPGFLYSRFRVNTTGGLAPTGLAADGEVEDYTFRIDPDTTGPTATAGALEYDTAQSVTIKFDEPLLPGSVSASDLLALNLDDGTTPAAVSVTSSAGGTVWTWTFNTPSPVTNGDYTFTLPAGAVTDTAFVPNPSTVPFVLTGPGIYYLGGDANRDGKVNTIDFNILAANFGAAPGNPFSKGNFSYSGPIDSVDFGILVGSYGLSGVGPGPLPASPFAEPPADEESLETIV